MKRLFGSLVIASYLPGQRTAPFLPRERVEAIRDRQVRRIVAHAVATVPHYRDLFAREGWSTHDIRGADDLARLPLLDRDAIRHEPRRFLSGSPRGRASLGLLTSGSTGTPLEIHHDHRSILANIAYGERERAPVIALCGGSFRPRELHIGYQTSNFRRILDFHASHARLPVKPRRDALSMTAPFDEIVEAINRVRPDVLTAYGGFLDTFFRTAEARGVDLHRPKVVMYVGETLPVGRREWIERQFGARVMSRYCAVEAFKIGYFCDEGTGFHLHDDLCHVRVLSADHTDARPGEAGEIVISNLVNYATVLLNYPMGDIAALPDRSCPCGRTHRLMTELQGRREDMLPLPNGEHLHPRAVWAVFKDDRAVLQYQLIQHDLRRFELKMETASLEVFAQSAARARGALHALLGGDAEIHVTRDSDLGRAERARTGKFRTVESRCQPAHGQS
jgi:phenylacetate-coenzyme A ligase PaaK-like adenylate-forming protein